VLARLGWEPRAGERDVQAVLRSGLIAALGALGDPATIAEARRRYEREQTDPAAVPATLRKAIHALVARHADAVTWEALRARARAERTPLARDRFYRELASSEDEALARRALELALTDEPGATTSPNIIATVARLHPELAFGFAVAHLERVDQLLDAPARTEFYAELAEGSLQMATIAKLEAYAAAHLDAASRRPVERSIASIRHSDRVRRERLPLVDAWLQAHPEN